MRIGLPASAGSRFLSAGAVVFVVLWLALLVFGRSSMLRDPGSFWHVVVGQRILATGQVVHDDPFSFTFDGRPWVADQWLAECGMAIVHRLAAWDGLLLLTAAVLAAVYAWIAARLLRTGLHWLPTCLVVALLLAASSPQFHIRPLVWTIALLAVTFALLVDVEAGKTPARRLWWLVPLMVVWSNLHGGALGGIGTVTLWAVGWSIVSIWSPGSAAGRPCSPLQLFLLVSALVVATLVNPYGPSLPCEWFETLAMPLSSLLVEQAGFDPSKPMDLSMLLLALGYVIVLVGVLPSKPRIVWLLPLVWFALTLGRIRHAALMAVTMGIALADMLPYSRVGRWLERRELLGKPRPSGGWPPVIASTILVAAMFGIQVAGIQLPVVGRGWAKFDSVSFPIDLLPRIEEIDRTSDDGTPIFNDMNFGGFLIYHAPRLRVFIDDRCSLYGSEFLMAYDAARCKNPAMLDEWQRQYGFDHALVETGGLFDQRLSGQKSWIRLGRSRAATLYRRR